MAIAGAILLVIGGIGSVFAQSVYAPSATADCSSWPTNCTVTAPVTNSGTAGFTSPFTAYFVYYNTLNQVVLIDQVPWTSSQTSVSDSGFTPKSVPGAGNTLLGFSVNVFFWDSGGRPMGPSLPAYVTFSVPIHFTIFYAGVGSITVSPPGSTVNQCTSQCNGGTAYYQAYWASGTQVTVKTSAGVPPVTWANSINSGCPADSSGSGFDCTFTISQTLGEAFITGSSSLPSQAIIVYAINGGGGVSPLEICLSAQSFQMSTPNLACAPSGTFTLTQPAAWSVQQQISGAVLKSGSGSSATLNFADYSNQVTFSAGLGALNFVTGVPSTLTIQQPTVAGVSITPAPGTYTCSATSSVCQPGGTVQLTATVPSGYQFQDWIVNGQNVATTASYALQIPNSGATAVAAYVAPTGSTPPPPPPPPCSGSSCNGSNPTASAVFFGLGVGGGVMLVLGLILPSGRKAR